MIIACPACSAIIDLGDEGTCPICGILLRRFSTRVVEVDDKIGTRQRWSHPDPIKRKEAELAAKVREWFKRELPPLDRFPPINPGVPPELSGSWESRFQVPSARDRLGELRNRLRQAIPGDASFRDLPLWDQRTDFRLHDFLEGCGAGILGLYIIDKEDRFVVNREFGTVQRDTTQAIAFARRIRAARNVVAELVVDGTGAKRYVGCPLGGGAVILFTGAESLLDETMLRSKLDLVSREFHRVLDNEVSLPAFLAAVEGYVSTPKISFVGYPGVGKTTLITRFNGGVPPQTFFAGERSGLGAANLQATRIGEYRLYAWDATPENRTLWDLLLLDSQAIVIVTDSTATNVSRSREIIDFVRARNVRAHLLAIANKQDSPGALSPNEVQSTLGIRTIGTVATDPNVLRDKDSDDDHDDDTSGMAPRPPPPPAQPPASGGKRRSLLEITTG